MSGQLNAEQVLRWHIEAGADEAIGERPVDRFTVPATRAADRPGLAAAAPNAPRPPATPRPAPAAASPATASSARLAQACASVDELRQAVETYDGCGLKRTC